MANLTIHHDHIWQILIPDNIIGHYLGHFGLGWLHFRVRNTHIIPFLQLFEEIIFYDSYGMVKYHLWDLRKTTDIVFVSKIVCVFSFMAQVYSNNARASLNQNVLTHQG